MDRYIHLEIPDELVLRRVGRQQRIISEFAYQGVMAVIAGNLLVTPLLLTSRVLSRREETAHAALLSS